MKGVLDKESFPVAERGKYENYSSEERASIGKYAALAFGSKRYISIEKRSAPQNFNHAHIQEAWQRTYHIPTCSIHLYGRYLWDGPGFLHISTIINKETNKLVLKNVCYFQWLGITSTEFVDGSVYVDPDVSIYME